MISRRGYRRSPLPFPSRQAVRGPHQRAVRGQSGGPMRGSTAEGRPHKRDIVGAAMGECPRMTVSACCCFAGQSKSFPISCKQASAGDHNWIMQTE